MLRSVPMAYCQMFLQPETAFETITELGEMGCVQFLDMNTAVAPYLKNYISDVCRCAEIERKLRYIESEMLKEPNLMYVPYPDPEPPPIHPSEFDKFENLINKWESEIHDISEDQLNLMVDLLEMKEMSYIMAKIGPILDDAKLEMETFFARNWQGSIQFVENEQIYILTGVVKRVRSLSLQSMLWRVSYGNVYYRQAEEDAVLVDPYTGETIRKVAFLVACQGEMIFSRIQKVLSGFHVNLYPFPETYDRRIEHWSIVHNRLIDLDEVLRKSKLFRCWTLRAVGKQWQGWMIQVRKAKAVYHNMNLMTLDVTKNRLIGQCWVAEHDLKKVQNKLEACSVKMEESVPYFITQISTNIEPPTSQRTNTFTHGFQMLINAYGAAKYREVNPGLFAIISYPFLFAVMFSDFGHAIFIFGAGLWMILKENKYMKYRGSEVWNIVFSGRYVIFFLGLWSLYTGFVYNEIFSKSINLSKSMWKNTRREETIMSSHNVHLDGRSRQNKQYVFGMDPIWQLSVNKIQIDNSIKMKMAVIIGTLHMMFGLMLSVLNHRYFKNAYAIYLQFLPQFLFIVCIFFWLVMLIFYKWWRYFDKNPNPDYISECAPSLLMHFVNRFIPFQETNICIPRCKYCHLFPVQHIIEAILLFISILSVLLLLFGTPTYIYCFNQRVKRRILESLKTKFRGYRCNSADIQKQERLLAELAKYSTPYSEMLLNQSIHTIEFVMSTISHTASYLRLWALSLAHSQLTSMLWMMILSKLGLRQHSPRAVPMIFFAFMVWAGLTVAFLVVIEGLCCFLHTLRLHWVEFMSKFYIDEGYAFRPFSFKDILAGEGDRSETYSSCNVMIKKRIEKRIDRSRSVKLHII